MVLLLGMLLVMTGALGVGLGLKLGAAGTCVAVGGLLLLAGARRRQRHESSSTLPAIRLGSHQAEVRRKPRTATPIQSSLPIEPGSGGSQL